MGGGAWQKTRNRNQRHETGKNNGNQPAGRNRNQRTPVAEPLTATSAVTQGFFCIEYIAIVITSSSKHVFCRQSQCLQAMRCQSRLRVAVFSQVRGASTCSVAYRRQRRQSFAGLVGAAVLTLVPNAKFGPGLLTSPDGSDDLVWAHLPWMMPKAVGRVSPCNDTVQDLAADHHTDNESSFCRRHREEARRNRDP